MVCSERLCVFADLTESSDRVRYIPLPGFSLDRPQNRYAYLVHVLGNSYEDLNLKDMINGSFMSQVLVPCLQEIKGRDFVHGTFISDILHIKM